MTKQEEKGEERTSNAEHETGNGCGQHARGYVTCKTLKRLLIDAQTSRHMLICMCICGYVFVLLHVWTERRWLGGCILGRVTSRDQSKQMLFCVHLSVVSLYL